MLLLIYIFVEETCCMAYGV